MCRYMVHFHTEIARRKMCRPVMFFISKFKKLFRNFSIASKSLSLSSLHTLTWKITFIKVPLDDSVKYSDHCDIIADTQ